MKSGRTRFVIVCALVGLAFGEEVQLADSVTTQQPTIPDPPSGLPPIPFFWFYNELTMEVLTWMGPKDDRNGAGCEVDRITGDRNPRSPYDYHITRYEPNGDAWRTNTYAGSISSLKDARTEKDKHAALNIHFINERVAFKEFLLFVGDKHECGVVYVSKPTSGQEEQNKGTCLLRIKAGGTYLACVQAFINCTQHTECYYPRQPNANCESETYKCKRPSAEILAVSK